MIAFAMLKVAGIMALIAIVALTLIAWARSNDQGPNGR